MTMRRTRARALAVSIVGLAVVGSAYADLVVTPTSTAQSSFIPASTPGDVVFSVRNDTGTSLMITGLSAMAPGSGDTNGCPSFTATPMTASLAAGQQQQFKIDASGFAAGNYACTYQVDTNPAMVPAAKVTVRFQVSAAPSNGNVQPAQMDFGTLGSGMFESQTLYVTNYSAPASGMQLTIAGDATHSIVFGPPCDGQQLCTIGAVATNATGTVPIKCAPLSSGTFTATVSAGSFGSGGSGGGSGSSTFYGSTQVTCSTPAFGMLSIFPNPIVILGPQGVQTSPVTITVNYSGSGGSAVLTSAMMMGDPTLGIVECGGPGCSNLSEPFPAQLGVYCTPGSSGAGAVFVSDSNGDMTSASVTCSGSGSGSGGMPFMTVSPMNLGFPPTPIGSSMNGSAQVANQGTTSLANIQIAVGGINGSDFSVSPCMTGSPCSLGPGGATQDLTVMFTPHGLGLRSGTLMVTANDPINSPQTISLSGSGAGAVMTVTSPMNNDLDFGIIPRGQPVTMPITIANTGNLPLTATIAGVAGPYSVAQGTIGVSGPGSGSFQITCQSATASGSNDQTFTITSPDAYTGSPQTITAHCAIANTQLGVDPNPIHLGEHRIGSPEATVDVTLTNPGSAAPASIQHVRLASQKTGLSLVPADTSTTLAAGSAATVTLHLATATEVDLAGENLIIAVDGEMLQIPVDGKVVTASSRVAPERARSRHRMRRHAGQRHRVADQQRHRDAPDDGRADARSELHRGVRHAEHVSVVAARRGATAVTTVSPAASAMGVVTGTLDMEGRRAERLPRAGHARVRRRRHRGVAGVARLRHGRGRHAGRARSRSRSRTAMLVPDAGQDRARCARREGTDRRVDDLAADRLRRAARLPTTCRSSPCTSTRPARGRYEADLELDDADRHARRSTLSATRPAATSTTPASTRARAAAPAPARRLADRARARLRLSSGAAAADLLQLGEEQIDLLGLRVEVRRDPDPDAGPVIAEELAAVELAADVRRADEVEHDASRRASSSERGLLSVMPSSSTQSMHFCVITRLFSRILRTPISPMIVWPARD